MASIYDATDGTTMAEGLQGCDTCDEAMQAAERIIREGDYPDGLELVDDDGIWRVLLMTDGLVRYRLDEHAEADGTVIADTGW